MGKGDQKTKRGKIIRGSYGRLRPRKKPQKVVEAVAKPKPKAKKEKTAKAKKAEKVEKVEVAEVEFNAAEEQATLLGNIGAADAANKNDLKKISGVGKVFETKLNDIGIFTFEQISKLTDEDIERVDGILKHFPGRIKRDNWVDQAKEFMAG